MRCPSCGALNETGVDQCPECAAFASERAAEESGADLTSSPLVATAETLPVESAPTDSATQNSRLIEFPGVSRSSLPHWRKELSERVREVQERRAREAALEAAEEQQQDRDQHVSPQPQLELLAQTEVVPLNPLVAAALRRIERAHQPDTQSVDCSPGTYAVAAVAYATETQFRSDAPRGLEVAELIETAAARDIDNTVSEGESTQPDKVHNLVVVPPRVEEPREQQRKSKPQRMIADNDPALDYLDSIPTTIRIEAAGHRSASAFSRLLAAIIDLIVVALLCIPVAAVVELTISDWQDLRVLAVLAGVFLIVGFLYLTISTALTGRTLGTRLFSLRIVDARTGLIPTGKQSAGRSVVYLATLLTLGLASLYALVDSDKRTPQDRLTRTAVITV